MCGVCLSSSVNLTLLPKLPQATYVFVKHSSVNILLFAMFFFCTDIFIILFTGSTPSPAVGKRII